MEHPADSVQTTVDFSCPPARRLLLSSSPYGKEERILLALHPRALKLSIQNTHNHGCLDPLMSNILFVVNDWT